MKKWKEFLAIAIIILASAVFFWPVWSQGKLPIPADALVGLYHPFRDYFSDKFPQGVPYKNFILTDPVLQQYPWKWLAIRTLLGGESLEENPYSFGGWGASSIENIQAGTFYPLNILFFLVNNFPAAWTIFIIIQPILASLFMFWWLKNNGIKHIAAIFGGLVWAFSSFNLVWMEWGNIGHAGLWLPLVLLAVDKIKRKKEEGKGKKALWHGTLQFSLIASLLAGHWQVTLYLLIAVGLYLLMNRKFSLLITHYSLLIVLTSFQWLPAWRFMAASNRQVEQENVLSREGFFIKPKHLVQLISPDFFGNPATGNYRGEWNYSEQVIYIGIIPLILAILAMMSIVTKQIRKDVVNLTCYSISSLQRFGLILIAAGLIFAVRNPIAEMSYKLNIPIWSDLQPTRLGYLVTFGLSILAAVGFQNLLDGGWQMLKKVLWASSAVGLSLFFLLIVSSKLDFVVKMVSQRNLIFSAVIYFAFLFLISAKMVLLNKKISGIKFSLFLVSCFLFLTVADLFRFGWKFTPFSPPEYLYPVTPAIKFLQKNMGSGDKYMTLDRRILPPNANIMYKLESIEGYDPIYSRTYALLITRMETGELQDVPANFGRIVRPGNFGSPVAGELGVKYVLALGDIQDDKLTKVFQEGETRIYELVKGE